VVPCKALGHCSCSIEQACFFAESNLCFLPVDTQKQGRDLRNFFPQGLPVVVQNRQVVTGNKHDHGFTACSRLADNEIAKQAGMVPEVIGGKIILQSKLASEIQNAIAELGLEPALFNIENLIISS